MPYTISRCEASRGRAAPLVLLRDRRCDIGFGQPRILGDDLRGAVTRLVQLPDCARSYSCAGDAWRSVRDAASGIDLPEVGFLPTAEVGGVRFDGVDIFLSLPHVDIVKAPHHGSPTSSSELFVAATRPAVVVISCGRGNHFGFPAPSVLARWQTAGASVARTDTDGSVIVVVDAGGTITVERTAAGT